MGTSTVKRVDAKEGTPKRSEHTLGSEAGAAQVTMAISRQSLEEWERKVESGRVLSVRWAVWRFPGDRARVFVKRRNGTGESGCSVEREQLMTWTTQGKAPGREIRIH